MLLLLNDLIWIDCLFSLSSFFCCFSVPINSLKYCTVNNIILFEFLVTCEFSRVECLVGFFFFVFWFEIGKYFHVFSSLLIFVFGNCIPEVCDVNFNILQCNCKMQVLVLNIVLNLELGIYTVFLNCYVLSNWMHHVLYCTLFLVPCQL